jgi:GT2 family glycosyltransferase
LNWNGKEDTLECLASVRQIAYSNFEVVVVDNGSDDGSPETIASLFPQVTLIKTGKNLGYAGGNNVGLRHALASGAQYFLLLNNDTIVDANILTAFVEASAAMADSGILSAKIYYHSEPRKLWYAGVRLEKPLRVVHVGQGQIDDETRYGSIVETEYACGCALFAQTDIVRKVGFLDEQYFLVYEEVDWCYRAKSSGYKSFVVPNAKVWHKVSASFGGATSPLALYFFKRNTLLFARKHLPLARRLAVYVDVFGEIARSFWVRRPRFAYNRTQGQSLAQACWWSLASYGRMTRRFYAHRPDRCAHFWAIRDFLLGRSGNCADVVRSLNSADIDSVP